VALEDYDTRLPLEGHCGEPGCPRRWDGQRTTFHPTPNPIAMTGWVNADKQLRCLRIWSALLQFSERSGEEAAYSLMQRISALMTDAIHEEGGTVRSFTGDGVMALFGVPIALEDAPLRACRAALDIQQRISSAAAEIETKYGMRPLMRIGINTGPMIVGEMRSGASTSVTAIGDTVNLASRLQSLAEPGRVLLSEATHRLVQGLVQCGPAGEYEIKGKTERQKAFHLDRFANARRASMQH